MTGSITNVQKFTATATFRDNRNQTLSVDGVPSWQASDLSLVTLEPAADGLSCVVSSTGSVGECELTCVADVDLGSGVVSVVATATVEVTDSGLFVGEITFSTPTQR